MYGMIHKAAKDFTIQQKGEAVWQDIVSKSALNEEHFISGQHYGDETTISLLVNISEELGIDLNALLFEFGKFWIKFTAMSSYGTVMDMAGDDLVTFVNNLDDMHRSIRSTMPEARMPSFFVERQSNDEIELVYCSERTGLNEFVRGLLTGLMDRFDEKGEISAVERGDDVVFLIRRSVAHQAA